MPLPKIAIIGCGSVGSTIAYALMLNGLHCEIIMNDLNTNLQSGQVKDLQDASFLCSTVVNEGTLKDCGQADIIIVTAGAKQKPGESRDELLDRNKNILSSIIKEMGDFNQESIWLVVSNPVDTMTRLTQELTKLPYNQVIGTGTLLDSLRLRAVLSERLNVNPQSIHALVIGEHGDKQFVLWSSAIVGGIPLLKHEKIKDLNQEALDHFSYQAMRRAYTIIDLKGSTHFGIGNCTSILCDTILGNKNIVYPVSCYHPKFGGYLSYPSILSRKGAQVLQEDLQLNESEQNKLNNIVSAFKK